MRNYFQLAQDCMINIKDEADAIRSYNEMINHLATSDIPDEERQEIVALIGEIIQDELDHIRILKGIYTGNFDIEPDEEPEGEPVITEGETDDHD